MAKNLSLVHKLQKKLTKDYSPRKPVYEKNVHDERAFYPSYLRAWLHDFVHVESAQLKTKLRAVLINSCWAGSYRW